MRTLLTLTLVLTTLATMPTIPNSRAADHDATTRPIAKAAFVQNLEAATPQKIVFFGTSLSAAGAYVPQVQAALKAAFGDLVTFHNGAKSGEHSRWGLANVQKNVVDQKPDVVFIEFTTNDAADRFKLSVAESRANHEKIIDAILAANPDCQVILQVMNPIVGKPPGHMSYRSDLPAYEQMYRDLASARGLTLIDHHPAWQALLDKGEAEYLKAVPDGVHPNTQAWATYVTPTILKTLGIPASPAQ